MLNAKITGIASYVPDDVLDNEELSRMVDTSDEWITTRVGIKERRVLKNGKGSSFLGTQAVQKLLNETGTSPDDVDLLICVTSNPDYRFPSTASVIMHNCGMDGANRKCYGFDIQAACAGFVVGAYTANAYIKSGLYKKVILVVAEKMTSMTDYQDRATCPLFGDAGAAVLIEPTENTEEGIIDGIYHIDGSGLEHLVYKAGGSARPASIETVQAREHFVYQEGRAVYRHAVVDMLTSTRDVMKRNNLTNETIDWFVPHQANLRIIEAVGDRLGIAEEKILVNIQHRGNTSAASIPLCLDENGDKIVLTAFGAGFTWGAAYIVWAI